MGHYLVTGGCGFIGSHLVDALLARGDRVTVLDNLSTGRREQLASGAQLVQGDVADPEIVRRLMVPVDGCFHLAAIASVPACQADWTGSSRVNLGGTIAVLEAAARSRRQPVVYASSAAVYGRAPTTVIDEDVPRRPLSTYGADKRASELHAFAAGAGFGLPTFGLRFFNVYGPRQDASSPYSGVISRFASRIAAGQPITVFGDGRQSRDFVYVSDVVRALLLAMDNASAEGPVVNVCTGQGTTIADLARTLMLLTGLAVPVLHEPALPGDIRLSLGSPARARALLRFKAEVDLAEGLACFLEPLAAAA